MKSKKLTDIVSAYSNIFPLGNDDFDNIIGESNTTAYGNTGIMCLMYLDDIAIVNSISKNDSKFPVSMLKDIIHLAKTKDKMVLSTSRKKELTRFANQFGFKEIEIGFCKGI
jgi:hypothetical protein